MIFAKYCYNLYRLYWFANNTTRTETMKAYEEYLKEAMEKDDLISFDEYVRTRGINKKRYDSYREFLAHDWKNPVFMEELLSHDEVLIGKWQKEVVH